MALLKKRAAPFLFRVQIVAPAPPDSHTQNQTNDDGRRVGKRELRQFFYEDFPKPEIWTPAPLRPPGIMFGADRELMDQWLWLLIAIGAAVILAAAILLTRKKERTREDYALLTLGPTLVVLGIIFGDDPLIGYSFIGVGVLLSIISAIRSRSKRMKQRSAN
jgi:hypothetical protein